MKLSIRRLITVASVVGGLAVLSGGAALADDGQTQTQNHAHAHHAKRGGLLEQAQKLDGLSAEQNQSIEQLRSQRRAAAQPVRQADAKLLTDLAAQVDASRVDADALEPDLTAEQQAAQGATAADASALTALHGLLTPAQRSQLVDRIESSAKSQKHKDALEAFRGDSFDASALVRVRVPGERAVRIAQAKVPQMTQEQRTHFAEHLRARATRESKG